MKTLCLLLAASALSVSAVAQKTEFSVYANAGFSNFRGTHANSSTTLYVDGVDNRPILVSKLYGTKPGFSFGGGVQVQRVTASNFLYGAQAGAELLHSKIAIDEVWVYTAPMGGPQSGAVPATGKSVMVHPYLNVNPYLGRRWQAAALDVDVSLGADFGLLSSSKQRAEATTANGETYSVNSLPTVGSYFDIRPKAGIAVYRNHFGVFASYAHGVNNYKPLIVDGRTPEAYRNVFRTGINYRF